MTSKTDPNTPREWTREELLRVLLGHLACAPDEAFAECVEVAQGAFTRQEQRRMYGRLLELADAIDPCAACWEGVESLLRLGNLSAARDMLEHARRMNPHHARLPEHERAVALAEAGGRRTLRVVDPDGEE